MTTETTNTIVGLLKENFCGRAAAAPIERIVDELCSAGVATSRRHFQLKVKPALLELGYVLGACGDGMFLCCEPSDYGLALQWYEQRIDAEQRAMSRIVTALVKFQPDNAS
jgi:(2Fe-2S) ferredoxin